MANKTDSMKILKLNRDLPKRMKKEQWKIDYDKKSDMFLVYGVMPEGSYYKPIGKDGLLLRLDKNNIIHGIAIDNFRYFVRVNPEFEEIYSTVTQGWFSFIFQRIRKANKEAIYRKTSYISCGRLAYS